jgi:hypothetical protein
LKIAGTKAHHDNLREFSKLEIYNNTHAATFFTNANLTLRPNFKFRHEFPRIDPGAQFSLKEKRN